MIWIEQGGLMTWPLLALSVTVLAILLDRAIVFSTLRLPDSTKEAELIKAIEAGDKAAACAMVESDFPFVFPLVKVLASDLPNRRFGRDSCKKQQNLF